jgi:murein tripeptide amidase MpaA
LKLTNAGASSYADGWRDYRAVASEDRETWSRVATDYDGETLTIRHTPAADSVYFAYFAPYSMERHADLIADAQGSARVRLSVLGSTLDGQDMDLLRIGEDGEGKRTCWIVARQHCGETMAEWWMEGFLARLLDEDDPVARELLGKAVFYVVPNMNPDGSRRGHLRGNAMGTDLNRQWLEPSLEKSPEVFLVRKKMAETGVDFCLDVHGDEVRHFNFMIGPEGIPSWSDRLGDLLQGYKKALRQVSPDFQIERGDFVPPPGKANTRMCGKYVAEAFGCLSMTLEMPFNDTLDTPHAAEGWSPERSRKLGAANLDALYAIIDRLR